MIGQLNLQLQETKVQLTNLKHMLQEYESINQHAIAERDELFAITHEQQNLINRLKTEINTLNGNINTLNSNINTLNSNLQQTKNAHSQLQMMREQYNIIFNQLSTIKQQYTEVITDLQLANKKVVHINPNELLQRDNKIK